MPGEHITVTNISLLPLKIEKLLTSQSLATANEQASFSMESWFLFDVNYSMLIYSKQVGSINLMNVTQWHAHAHVRSKTKSAAKNNTCTSATVQNAKKCTQMIIMCAFLANTAYAQISFSRLLIILGIPELRRTLHYYFLPFLQS